MIYILDVETTADKRLLDVYVSTLKAPSNYKDQAKIDAYISNQKLEYSRIMATDTDFSEILCIGIKELDGVAKLFTIEEFGCLLRNNPGILLITFNGKQFDLPCIIKNGIKQKADIPYYQIGRMTQKYRADNHIDLMEALSFGGQWKSLDMYSRIYLGRNKKEIDFDLASPEEIIEHCMYDLCLTEELFKKFQDVLM